MSETPPPSSLPPAAPPSPPPRGGDGRGRVAWAAGGILAAALLAVGVNMLAGRAAPGARLDLTADHLYTLSPGTRSVLAGLKEPITLRLFYSEQIGAEAPLIGGYEDRVREMLREYAQASHGMLRLESFNPQPYSETEEHALGYGLQGVPIDEAGTQVYFGLVGTNMVDDERTIPFMQIDRERFLEYDLTRLIYELTNPKKPVLGVISSLPLNGDARTMMMMRQIGQTGGQPYAVMQQLQQFFTVENIPENAQVIDPDVQVLMVVHPQHLSLPAQYAIDQFVMRGGKLMLFTDPWSEGQASRPGPDGKAPTDATSSLPRLMNAWGLEVPANKVVLDLKGAWHVRAGTDEHIQAVSYPAWYSLSGNSINRSEVATAAISTVTVASPGEVLQKPGSHLQFVPLLTSSPESEVVDVGTVSKDPDPQRILADFHADGGKHVIAARIRGELHSAFPDGPPAEPAGQQRPPAFPAHLAESKGPANVVVFNDADVLEDRFWIRDGQFFGQGDPVPISGNGAMVVNIADELAGSDALISLRSQGNSQRPFVVVDDIRRRAEADYRQTEQNLQQKLEATERRLASLRQGTAPQAGASPAARNQDQATITPAQEREIEQARTDILATRQQLRAVQFDMRADITRLENWMRVLNIALVPALLIVFAIGLALWRLQRRGAARS